jgi:hypothetical protein
VLLHTCAKPRHDTGMCGIIVLRQVRSVRGMCRRVIAQRGQQGKSAGKIRESSTGGQRGAGDRIMIVLNWTASLDFVTTASLGEHDISTVITTVIIMHKLHRRQRTHPCLTQRAAVLHSVRPSCSPSRSELEDPAATSWTPQRCNMDNFLVELMREDVSLFASTLDH